MGNTLGPGQYLSHTYKLDAHARNLPKFSAAFKTEKRKDFNINKMTIDNPSPGDYMPDLNETLNTVNHPGNNRPFGINTKRFGSDENGVPGAGTYQAKGSCKVKNPGDPAASFKSVLKRDLNFVVDGPKPGSGEYETQKYKTISDREFQGGAPNNFAFFSKHNI